MQARKFQTGRYGAANPLLLIVLAVAAILVVVGWLLLRLPATDRNAAGEVTQPLFVYCAAGTRPASERIAKQYEEEFGVAVQLQFGGSNTLLSQIEAAQTGDCYIAAEEAYIQMGREKDLVAEAIPLAWQEPVVAVGKGNPKSIKSIDDLLRDGVTTAMGNPDQAAIGKVTRRLLQASGHWDRLEQHITKTGVFKPTVPEVASDVKIGSIDAGIIWDATAFNANLEFVRLPELSAGKAQIQIGVLKCSKNARQALHFCRYMGAKEKGLKVFKDLGFAPVDGDAWADRPELVFYCGSVNRRAVEPILKQFEQREGVSITTVYNGCGILSGQMKAITRGDMPDSFPDVYMACDVYYLQTVEDLFQDAVNVSDTDIVLVVPKGNPKNIRSLKDLTNEGVRIAIGQPEQCTIGVLTKQLLTAAGVYDEAMKNVHTEVPTSSMLIPTVTTQSADVTLAYACDTLSETGRVDVIPIDRPEAKAIQPIGIARASSQKQLSKRLYQAVANSQASFEAAGFHFRLGDGVAPERTTSDSDAGKTAVPND